MNQTTSSSLAAATTWIAAFSIASAALFGQQAAAQDRGQGLLLLHSREQSAALEQALPGLEDRGCVVWRRGSVAGTQGDLDVGSPDGFALFSCDSEILGSADHRRVLSSILDEGTEAMAVEGPIVFRTVETADAEAQAERDYVLKISRYSNLDPNGRAGDLDSINAAAAEQADAWSTEASIAGLRAVGLATPDEVVVIHYDDPQQGERFRDRNPDILRRIGDFNRNHLLEFVYISVAVGG